jgi:hypothetical protein
MARGHLLSVSAFHRPMHLSLFSPLGDPSKPGTGTALLSLGGMTARPPRITDARTSPRRDDTVVSPQILCLLDYRMLNCLGLVKRSPALQACNRMRNSQADGAPRALAPETSSLRSFSPLAAGVMPLKRMLASHLASPPRGARVRPAGPNSRTLSAAKRTAWLPPAIPRVRHISIRQ